MTDYLYSFSLASQTKSFLLSLGFGFIMGILYDVFRMIRISFSKNKKSFLFFDIVYCVILCFCSYLFFLTVNEGSVRMYLLFGEAAGFGIYYFSLGIAVFKASEKLISVVKSAVGKIFKTVLFPFLWIFRKLRKIFKKISSLFIKKGKNIKNKSNFLLKVYRHLLYNLKVKMVKNGVSEEKEV